MMRFLTNMQLRRKLLTAFTLLISSIVIIAVLIYFGMGRFSLLIPNCISLHEIVNTTYESRMYTLNFMQSHRQADGDSALIKLQEAKVMAQKLSDARNATSKDDSKSLMFNQYAQLVDELSSAVNQLIEVEEQIVKMQTSLLTDQYNRVSESASIRANITSHRSFLQGTQLLHQFLTSKDLGVLDRSKQAFKRAEELLDEEQKGVLKSFIDDFATLSGLYHQSEATKEKADSLMRGYMSIVEKADAFMNKANAQFAKGLIIWLIGSLLVLIGVFSPLMYLDVRSLIRIVDSVVEVLTNIKEGDLGKQVNYLTKDTLRKDELGTLLSSSLAVREKMMEIVSLMSGSTSELLTASNNMNQAAQDIATGANSQASSAEEVSSAVEEMTANIDQNTDNAQQTEKVASMVSNALEVLIEQGDENRSIVQTIAEKISVVNEIADQTNILALNAAVEAARAGEHGRGFAVVAAEVRKLAERSGEAANEVIGLVGRAVSTTEKVTETLDEIKPQIQNSLMLSREVATASLEQRNGADQINKAVQLLSNVSQENAASSDHLAQNAVRLAELAKNVGKNLEFFRTDGKNARDKNTPPTRTTVPTQTQSNKSTTTPAQKPKSEQPAAPTPSKKETKAGTPATTKTPISKPAIKPTRPNNSTTPKPATPKPAAPKPAAQASEPKTQVTETPSPKERNDSSSETPKPMPGQAVRTKSGGVMLDMSMGTASDSDYESF